MPQMSQKLLTLAIGSALCATANAQWTGSLIHPADNNFSLVRGGGAGQAVGGAGLSLGTAGIWSQGGSVYTSLHQQGWVYSGACATDGIHQVGGVQSADWGSFIHAARWSGVANTWESLHPDGYTHSEALAVLGNRVGGWGTAGDSNRALLWTGGANSALDLTPRDTIGGRINALDASHEYGWVDLHNIIEHAAMWSGSSESFVDLNPEGFETSMIFAVGDGLQGGVSQETGASFQHATIWSGTAQSFVDINPEWLDSSEVNAIGAGYEVGSGWDEVNFVKHAVLWDESAGSALDLNQYLPEGFINAEATAIMAFADHIEIYGTARRGPMGDDPFAVMWTQPVPEPMSISILALGLAGIVARRRRQR